MAMNADSDAVLSVAGQYCSDLWYMGFVIVDELHDYRLQLLRQAPLLVR